MLAIIGRRHLSREVSLTLVLHQNFGESRSLKDLCPGQLSKPGKRAVFSGQPAGFTTALWWWSGQSTGVTNTPLWTRASPYLTGCCGDLAQCQV